MQRSYCQLSLWRILSLNLKFRSSGRETNGVAIEPGNETVIHALLIKLLYKETRSLKRLQVGLMDAIRADARFGPAEK